MLFVKYSSDCENETVCAAALRTEATAEKKRLRGCVSHSKSMRDEFTSNTLRVCESMVQQLFLSMRHYERICSVMYTKSIQHLSCKFRFHF